MDIVLCRSGSPPIIACGSSWFETRDADDLSLVGSYKDAPQGEWRGEERPRQGPRGRPRDGLRCGQKDGGLRRRAGLLRQVRPRDGLLPLRAAHPGQGPAGRLRRTISDLEALVAYQKAHGVKSAAVIGGGLLGLEAAKAMHDLGMKTHILEYAPILMCRQIDQGGHDALVGMVEDLGLEVHCDARTKAFEADAEGRVSKVTFETEGWDDLDVGIVVVSAGIRPRDEVARDAVECHERGGVVVSDTLQTSDKDVYAVGEVALHGGMIYGLVAPGYAMAEVAADHLVADLLGESASSTFEGADLSTKLKLLGCDVANFGEASGDEALVWEDKLSRTYRKLFFSKTDEGWVLRGGLLVGDADDLRGATSIVQVWFGSRGARLTPNPAENARRRCTGSRRQRPGQTDLLLQRRVARRPGDLHPGHGRRNDLRGDQEVHEGRFRLRRLRAGREEDFEERAREDGGHGE